ncbi:MAG: HIT family protein [Nanoarchaeota archaeon]|nr:HIT family protein [Nanoarchaeota archaeon]
MTLNPEQVEQIRQQFLAQIEKFPEDQREQLKQQIINATSEQLEAAMGPREGKEEECLFCGIANGTVATMKVYEDNSVVAFLDITPSVAGQVIVIPKEHQQFIFQISDQTLWNLFKVVKMLEPLIVNITKAGGLSIFISQGNAAGQHFKHLAINMVPRADGDNASFHWPRNEVKKEDLEDAAKFIKDGIDKMVTEEKARMEKLMKERHKVESKPAEKIQELPRRAA